MTVEPVTTTYGAMIRADAEHPTLASLPAALICDRFRDTGLVLFRGFPAGPGELDAIARRFSIDLMPGVGRSTFPEFKLIHLVNESLDELEAHTDNGTRPEAFRPDITWMWCEVPPESAGETKMFDGVAIWQQLSPDTRARLQRQRLAFCTRYAEAAWRAMRFPDLAAFRAFVTSIGGTMSPPGPDGAVQIEVCSSAYRRTHHGGHDAFVCSINLAGAKGFEHMVVRFEDGTAIPPEMLAEIKAAIAATCELIRWSAGDVAALDNTRYLHGRRAYTDTRRRIYLLQTHKANF